MLLDSANMLYLSLTACLFGLLALRLRSAHLYKSASTSMIRHLVQEIERIEDSCGSDLRRQFLYLNSIPSEILCELVFSAFVKRNISIKKVSESYVEGMADFDIKLGNDTIAVRVLDRGATNSKNKDTFKMLCDKRGCKGLIITSYFSQHLHPFDFDESQVDVVSSGQLINLLVGRQVSIHSIQI